MNAVFKSRSEVIAQQGMVATSHPLASQVGLQILQEGGSAVDAAIAANAMLSLVEPTGCGLGGDLCALVWDGEQHTLLGLNACGPAPSTLSLEHLLSALGRLSLDNIPSQGMLPITVPGVVSGWDRLHNRYGRLPWANLFPTTIDYAKRGFPVTEHIADEWCTAITHNTAAYPGLEQVFTVNGHAPDKGQTFKNPALANTLSIISEQGSAAFYSGDIAQQIEEYMRKHNGYLRYADLSRYNAQWVTPVHIPYKGYKVWQLPFSTQGIAVLQMLQIVQHFPLDSMAHFGPDYLHLMVEAKKLVYEDRAKYYASTANRDAISNQLLSDTYSAKRAALIKAFAAQRVDAGIINDQGDTICLTAADQYGNIVSLMQSNYLGMGSCVCIPELGFVFQNRGQLFSLDQAHANVYSPGKHPFHTIIPGFVTRDNKPFLSFGVMGGSMQPQGQVQVLTNMIDYGMDLQSACDCYRWRHEGSSEPSGEHAACLENGGSLIIEKHCPDLISTLPKKGHRVEHSTTGFGGFQGIQVDEKNQIYIGASDARKDGHAVGY